MSVQKRVEKWNDNPVSVPLKKNGMYGWSKKKLKSVKCCAHNNCDYYYEVLLLRGYVPEVI